MKRHNQIHERNKGNPEAVAQEVESNAMITDIILTEESVEGSQSDQLEPKILIDDNGQHYKIEMPPETESEIQGKIDSGNFYKMNYVDGATIWVSESNLNEWMLVVKLEFFLINEWETVICILFDHTSKWLPISGDVFPFSLFSSVL